MGVENDNLDSDFTFSPKLGKKSQKLARRRTRNRKIAATLTVGRSLHGSGLNSPTSPDNGDVSHLEVRTCDEEKEEQLSLPKLCLTHHNRLIKIPACTGQNIINGRPIFHISAAEEQLHNLRNFIDVANSVRANMRTLTQCTQQNEMSDRSTMVARNSKEAKDNKFTSIFTYRPQVSPQSKKIVENLGTDFMSRQRQHIEKQKQHIEQAQLHFKSPGPMGRLSPVQKPKRPNTSKHDKCKETKNCDENGNVSSAQNSPIPANSEDTTDATPPESAHSEPDSTNKCISTSSPAEDVCVEPDLITSRSKTMPPQSGLKSPSLNRRLTSVNLARLKSAKELAEKALKSRKIFTILGPYPAIRDSLRRRGWVEKFYKKPMHPKRSPRAKKKQTTSDSDSDRDDDDDDDDDDDTDVDDDVIDHGCKIPPWEEDNGVYGVMSRLVRNAIPTFIWSLRRDAADPKHLRKEQMLNHYGKAGSFTTKVGLCLNMRNLVWFDQADANTFFPRCYRLSHDEEKQTFIDDYRLTACTSVLICAQAKHASCALCSRPNTPTPTPDDTEDDNDQGGNRNKRKKKGQQCVPKKALEFALQQCEQYLKAKQHIDIDEPVDEIGVSDAVWDQFLQWYYTMVSEDGIIVDICSKMEQITEVLSSFNDVWPQYELDGYRNVWIVKPGAKSRGRGITCYDRLEDMLKLVSSTVVKKESKYVVQKYIERPLLVYNTKFDIRQWFLVTDWNPLTIWFYKDSYIRFCSQEYTLENFDESIHLSNNAIQKNYLNGPRSRRLPEENMWSSQSFCNFLKGQGHGGAWDDIIYPGMKKAVTGALLCSQDIVEYRKSDFELYGADFMLTEDLRPWLIEINCSPSMSSSTKVTAKLCANVLEDTLKVVIDRKQDKNCNVGSFEVSYKQPQVSIPPYIGINLAVEGQIIKKPCWTREKKVTETSQDQPVTKMSHVSSRICLAQMATKSKTVLANTVKTSPSASYKLAEENSSEKTEKPVPCNTMKKSVSTGSKPSDSTSTEKLRIGSPNKRKTSKSPQVGAATKHQGRSPSRTNQAPRAKVANATENGRKTPTQSSNVPKEVVKRKVVIKIDTSTMRIPNDSMSLLKGLKCDTSGVQSSEGNSLIGGLHGQGVDLGAGRYVPSPFLRRESENRTLVSSSLPNSSMTDEQVSIEKLAPSSTDRMAFPMGNAESIDLQAIRSETQKGILSAPLIDGTWGRTCCRCGAGMNLRLDPHSLNSCQCQQDGIRVASSQDWDSKTNIHIKGQGQSLPASGIVITPVTHKKPPLADRRNLAASMYAKTHNFVGRPDRKFVLKYTDAGIQKPDLHNRINPSHTLPKLVSRYMSKNNNNAECLSMYSDMYKQGSKLTIITQNFS